MLLCRSPATTIVVVRWAGWSLRAVRWAVLWDVLTIWVVSIWFGLWGGLWINWSRRFCSHRWHIFTDNAASQNGIDVFNNGVCPDSLTKNAVLAAQVLQELFLIQLAVTHSIDSDRSDSASSWILVHHGNAIVFLLQWVELITVEARIRSILTKLQERES